MILVRAQKRTRAVSQGIVRSRVCSASSAPKRVQNWSTKAIFSGATVKSHLVAPDWQALGLARKSVTFGTKASTDK